MADTSAQLGGATPPPGTPPPPPPPPSPTPSAGAAAAHEASSGTAVAATGSVAGPPSVDTVLSGPGRRFGRARASSTPDTRVLSLLSKARNFKPWRELPFSHSVVQDLALRARAVYDCVVGEEAQSALASPDAHAGAGDTTPPTAATPRRVAALVAQAFADLSREVGRLRVVHGDILLFGPMGTGKTSLANDLLRADDWPCYDTCARAKAGTQCNGCARLQDEVRQLGGSGGIPLPCSPGDHPTRMPVKAVYSSRLQLVEWFADGTKRALIDHGKPTLDRLLRASKLLRASQAATGARRPRYLVLCGPFKGLHTLLGALYRSGEHPVKFRVGVIDWPGLGHPDYDVALLREWACQAAAVLFLTGDRGGRGCRDPEYLRRMMDTLAVADDRTTCPQLVYVNNDRLDPSFNARQVAVLESTLQETWRRVAPRPHAGFGSSSSLHGPNPMPTPGHAGPPTSPGSATAYRVGAGSGAAGGVGAGAGTGGVAGALRLAAVPDTGVVVFYPRDRLAATDAAERARLRSVSGDRSTVGSPASPLRPPPPRQPVLTTLGLATQVRDTIRHRLAVTLLAKAAHVVYKIAAFLQGSLSSAAVQRQTDLEAAAAAAAPPSSDSGSGSGSDGDAAGHARRPSLHGALDALLVRWCHQHVSSRLKAINGEVTYRGAVTVASAGHAGLGVVPDDACERVSMMEAVLPDAGGVVTDEQARLLVRALSAGVTESAQQWAGTVVHRYRQGLAAAVVESGVQAVRHERRVSEAEAARVTARVHAALDVIAVGTSELLVADVRKVVREWGHAPAPAVLEQLRRDLGAVLQPAAPPAATGTVDGFVSPDAADYDGWSAAASTAVRSDGLERALVSLVTCDDSPGSAECASLAGRVHTVARDVCDAAFRFQLPALLAGVHFNRHLRESERAVLRSYARAIRQQAFYLIAQPPPAHTADLLYGPGLEIDGVTVRASPDDRGSGGSGGGGDAAAGNGSRVFASPGRRDKDGRASSRSPARPPGSIESGGRRTKHLTGKRSKVLRATRSAAAMLSSPRSLVASGSTTAASSASFALTGDWRGSEGSNATRLAAAAAAAIARLNEAPSSSSSEEDEGDAVLARPHLLRNVSRVSLFEPHDEDARVTDTSVASSAGGARAPGTKACRIKGCGRRTKRDDGLCPDHAELARALEEDGGGGSAVLLEARVAGVEDPAVGAAGSEWSAANLQFRVMVLEWHFATNELLEWVVHKTHADFEELRRRVLAACLSVHASAVLPPRVTVAGAHQDARANAVRLATANCNALTTFLSAVLAHHKQAPCVAAFLDVRPGRVDKVYASVRHPGKGKAAAKGTAGAGTGAGAGAGGDGAGAGAGAGAGPDDSDSSDSSVEEFGSLHRSRSSTLVGREMQVDTVVRNAPSPPRTAKSAGSGGSLGHFRAESARLSALQEGFSSTDSMALDHVIVTLGGPLNPDTSPGVWLQERIEAGVALYKRHAQDGGSVYLVFTGGDCAGLGVAEAEVMRRAAVEMGVPSRKVLTDCQAKDTIQNALLVVPLLIRLGIRRVSVVTSEFHVRRSKHYFESIFAAYKQPFAVHYVGVEDHMPRKARSLRDLKETLLTARSQPLLDASMVNIRRDRTVARRQLGRFSWSFSEPSQSPPQHKGAKPEGAKAKRAGKATG